MNALIILDGFGQASETYGNAIAQAKKPFYDSLIQKYPHTLINASGYAVGLPEGQMGNSEVGHLNLGAGRVVYQDITTIDDAIKNGSFNENAAFNRDGKSQRFHASSRRIVEQRRSSQYEYASLRLAQAVQTSRR